jgi:hydrogenase maturation protease
VTGRMLVAGVGNIFLGDDGFGVEVASRLTTGHLTTGHLTTGHLTTGHLPDWVQVTDYGIRGMHLAYDLAEGYDAAILVDATPRGGEPGTVYVIEPDRPQPSGDRALEQNPLFNAHGMQPDVILGMLDMLGAKVGRVLIVGCEPASVEHGIGLSEPVAAAVDEAVRVVLGLIEQYSAEPRAAAEPSATEPQAARKG